MRSRYAVPWLLVTLALPVAAETVSIPADRDATLIEDPAGALANGSGSSIFVGRTAQPVNNLRRALVRFDVAAWIPREAIIESAEITLRLASSNPQTSEVRLHRVLEDWGEGPSSSAGGQGAPAGPGDVTWLHTFYDGAFWVQPGSHFVDRDSARLLVGSEGAYTWPTTVHTVQDVLVWLRAPTRNFGWVLIGDETQPQTAKSFFSKESLDPSGRPLLVVSYRLPGER